MAKTMKDVTGDGKFTYADVLKMRGVKLKKKSMNPGGYVETKRPGRMSPLQRKGIVFAGSENPVSREAADNIVLFGRGRALDSAIQVPQFVYGRDSRGNMDPDLYHEMSPEEFARLRARGVEIGADIEDFADDLVREGQQQQPMMSEDDPRFVRKVYNSGMGADEPIEFYYYDQDKGKKLIQNYGGKVKLMKKGGTVDYFAGGALAAGLGQLAQRSQNPFLQKAGKVASMLGGLSPAGRAVNMAGNVLQNFIPAAGAQPNQQGVRDTQSVAQASPQQGGGLMSLLQSPMAQNLINEFTAKHGMVVPNAKVRLLKLER